MATPKLLDPDQIEDPVILYADHYPLPSLYRACLEESRKNMAGPSLYAAVDIYLMENLGSESFRDFFILQLGDTLYHAILAEVAPVLPVLIRSVEEGDTDEVVPSVSLFLSKALLFVMDRGMKTDIALVLKAIHAYCHNLEAQEDELYHHVSPLMPLLNNMRSFVYNAKRGEKWKRKIRSYLADVAISSKVLHDIIAEADAVLEEHHLAEESADVTSDGLIRQIDGSQVPDNTEEYIQLARPSERQQSAEEQITTTLASHENPYKASMELWWKLRSSSDPSSRHTEAWALDAAGRVLKKLFTPKQFKAMETLLPTDEIVGSLLHFILAEDGNAKNVTWPQLRVSCLFCAIAHVAMDADSLEKRAGEIYQKLELEDEFSIMQSAINIHSEAATSMILPWNRRTIT